jgi:hypothetical protein
MVSGRSLVFVYNIDSETLPKMNDHMSRMPITDMHECNLHAITFSPIGMKKEWKRFIHDLGIPVRILARDEFSAEFRSVAPYFPAAFLQEGSDLAPLINTEEIQQCATLEDLIRLVRERVA